MRNASPEGGCLEWNACLDAWRCHFRDVPASVAPSVSFYDCDPDLVGRVRNLRRAMSRITRQVDVAFTEPELFQVTQELPVNRAPAVGCRTRDFSFNVQDIPELVIEEFPTWAALPCPPVLPAFQPLFSAGRNCSCSQPPLLHTLGEEPCPGGKKPDPLVFNRFALDIG